jgi:hypothetical protein
MLTTAAPRKSTRSQAAKFNSIRPRSLHTLEHLIAFHPSNLQAKSSLRNCLHEEITQLLRIARTRIDSDLDPPGIQMLQSRKDGFQEALLVLGLLRINSSGLRSAARGHVVF